MNARALTGLLCAAAMLAGCGAPQAGIGVPPLARASQHLGSGNEQVLYAFTGGNDGGDAASGVLVDAKGNLYGTTVVGGTFACGTVFELTPQSGSRWRESVLHDFTCLSDGKNPYGGLAFDAHGQLVGTTVAGGSGGTCAGDGCGVVFALTSSGESVLHAFTGGEDGFGPGGAVAFDSHGNAFGTTPDGGSGYEGVIYEIVSGKQSHENVLHAFTGGSDGGVGSLGTLLYAHGDLYGVTEIGGANGAGTAFRLSRSGAHWKLTTLYAFKGSPDAGSPYGGLVAGASGRLYGTTYYGGRGGLGAVYELVPKGRHGYGERVLYSFKGGSDGSAPTSTLAVGKSGTLYGTTSAGGGSCGCGTIFSLNPASGKERVLHAFAGGSDGAYPYYGLTAGASGEFYGTTVAGGGSNQGTLFEFVP